MKSSSGSATDNSNLDSFNKENTVPGMVLEIQRMSTEDGPGLRTTVFLKGCPLACDWCHNPESISPTPQLVWQGTGCIGCRTCMDTCQNNALTLGPKGVVINRKRCQGCGHCADQCPSCAITLLGKRWFPQDLIRELVKDSAYFASSKGGVTLSGGEATLQPEFALQVFRKLQAMGIHTALDTCGMCAPGILEKLLPHVDLLLFDIKEMDSTRHKQFTGASNATILDNLRQLPELLKNMPPACGSEPPSFQIQQTGMTPSGPSAPLSVSTWETMFPDGNCAPLTPLGKASMPDSA